MDDDAVEPRIEPVRIAEPAQITPGDHQRVLQGILGSVDVAQDPLRQREQAIHARAKQVDERRLVAVLGRLHEVVVAVHVSVLVGAHRGAIRDYGRSRR